MKRRSRTRRVLKWVGLAGCVLTVLVFVATLVWTVEYGCWTYPYYHDIGTEPGMLQYSVLYDMPEYATWILNEGLFVDAAPPIRPNPEKLLQWPTMRRSHFPTGVSESVIMIPLWAVFLVLAVPTFILWRFDCRPSPGHCRHCGHNLAGNLSGVCPECGEGT